jgi:hypothetical protein
VSEDCHDSNNLPPEVVGGVRRSAVWQPSTAYQIGDKIVFEGFVDRDRNGKYVVTATGTSHSMPNLYGPFSDKKTFADGTMWLEKINETRKQA